MFVALAFPPASPALRRRPRATPTPTPAPSRCTAPPCARSALLTFDRAHINIALRGDGRGARRTGHCMRSGFPPPPAPPSRLSSLFLQPDSDDAGAGQTETENEAETEKQVAALVALSRVPAFAAGDVSAWMGRAPASGRCCARWGGGGGGCLRGARNNDAGGPGGDGEGETLRGLVGRLEGARVALLRLAGATTFGAKRRIEFHLLLTQAVSSLWPSPKPNYLSPHGPPFLAPPALPGLVLLLDAHTDPRAPPAAARPRAQGPPAAAHHEPPPPPPAHAPHLRARSGWGIHTRLAVLVPRRRLELRTEPHPAPLAPAATVPPLRGAPAARADPAPETETRPRAPAQPAQPAQLSAPPRTAPPPRGHLQPAHANVPRRAKPLSAARRRRARSVQELGRASGVFVALGCGEGADAREFGAVVRIVGLDGVGDNGMEDKAGGAVVRFVAASTRDDGVPSLAPAQLRAACAFVRAQQGRRVLITAPRAHAADALGVGVCCVAGAALDIPGDDMDADSGTDSHFDADLDWDSGAEAQADADAECVRRLVMRWHDLPAPASSSSTSSSTGEDDEDEDGGGGGGGLKDAWRGLLSRAGWTTSRRPCASPRWPRTRRT
ncbi:hypothetical protein B0H17DRAFT_1330843 [Mycena rosella]|uniref:Uncharacterized protein n=1 Tax=Mycena rosella TaxID=1033263 RepID=A0AAD7DII8_MYCRO|nr:hypothetical protein B0H17DRAFT_1330843 [Mycena rosella]